MDEEDVSKPDPNQLETLRKMVAKRPDDYIQRDKIDCCKLGDKEYVVGCPCNAMTAFEQLFWNDSRKICDYLGQRTAEMVGEALEREGVVELAKGAIERAEEAEKQVCCTACSEFKPQVVMDVDGVCLKCREKDRIAEEARREKLLDALAKSRMLEHDELEVIRMSGEVEDELPF